MTEEHLSSFIFAATDVDFEMTLKSPCLAVTHTINPFDSPDVAKMRLNYTQGMLLEEDVKAYKSPFDLFEVWFQDAKTQLSADREPNAL